MANLVINRNSKYIVPKESSHLTKLQCKNRCHIVYELVEFRGDDLGWSYLSGEGNNLATTICVCVCVQFID
ncbi:hypothetical protein GYH30_042287 [Glycine max]|uniref:Uncharacterized protein n=1 Tax=Glycine max TaxID=3847 RepID=A0A0R0G775_SOYBN|nr:hypothetical protein GYH30_042287 [Glycine max]